MASLAVVIPVYQAEASLRPLSDELIPALSSLGVDWTVWFIDDGSTDGSWAEVERLVSDEPRYRGVRLIRNFGEHVAITAGLDRVEADYVVIMACDQQDDPSAIAAMLGAARGGADLVLVRRMQRRDAFVKRLLARLFYAFISLLFSIDYDYRVGNFRLLTRRAVEYFRKHRERMRNVNAIMALMGVRTAYVDVPHRARRHGRSSYTLMRSARMAASVVIGYSDIPLVVSGAIGIVLMAAAALWSIAVAIGLAGPASDVRIAIAAVAGVGGLILLNLGIVGAYLGRAAREAKERPMYFVGDTLNVEDGH
ncbi:MAG: glycosyltransferase family 2 protein [Acidobacteria bacterium]|nr:glycosyltransferase family 2 protein [Acidobacteriota bacterium]